MFGSVSVWGVGSYLFQIPEQGIVRGFARSRSVGAKARRGDSVAGSKRRRANKDYFSGPDQVARVQDWRKENPSYSKEAYLRKKALQDDCDSQVVPVEEDTSRLMLGALQDDCELQVVLMVGLIASLTGCALQDDIASSIRKIHSRGLAVLAMETTKIGDGYEDQEAVVTPRAGASSP